MHEVAIIGAGPAGLSAALQLHRYGLPCLLLEGEQAGGLLRNANLVENYPGFPGGVPGPRLVELFVRQAEAAGVEVTYERVCSVAYQSPLFQIQTNAGLHPARRLVIASGTRAEQFEPGLVPSAAAAQVFYEVYPLLAERGRRVAIVGAGDAAFDYALNLARHNQVLVLNRGDQLKCLPLLWQRASQAQNIAYHASTRLQGVGRTAAGQLLLECTSPSGEVSFTVDYLVGALGRRPALDFLEPGWQENTALLQDTGVLYFIGDVKNGIFRQTSIAVGDGILAAMKIYRYLKENSV
ncbi:MAG: NAD(P)/FAD-dependent oxidoreductase [Chloroflexota bacterium]